MRFLEAQAGEDIKSIFLFLLGHTRSSWLLQRIQIKPEPAFEAGASLCTCGAFSLAALSPRSFVSWKLHRSEWQLCVWRGWAGVQVVGRRSAPSGTRRPNALAGEKHEREMVAQRGETDGSQQRKGAVTACRGPLTWRVCGSEFLKALFPLSRLGLSAISINVLLWHLG